jgi:CTP synthase
VYDVPINVLKSGVLSILNDFVDDFSEPDMGAWEELSIRRAKKYEKTVKVGLVTKYVGNEDAYICVTEALKAAAYDIGVNLDLVWINAEELTSDELVEVDGLVVPNGFGKRGMRGKKEAAKYALEHDVPYLGLAWGLQSAVLAAAERAGIQTEGKEDEICAVGERARLGEYAIKLRRDSITAVIYEEERIVERHRHRYEVNKKFLPEIEKGGVIVSGTSPDGELVEFVEAPGCKFFQACQAHPEFRSRPMRVHPLFREFVRSLTK